MEKILSHMSTLLVCDRSGGHIFPALTFAKKIKERNDQEGCSSGRTPSASARIYFFATSKPLKTYITEAGFRVYGYCFAKRNLIFELLIRPLEALFILILLRPKRVMGFGGRDSIFLMLCARLLGARTSIYEPNVSMGKANRFLLPFVDKVFCSVRDTFEHKKATVVGVPLRTNIRIIDKKQARKILSLDDSPVLFCFGGSQGSSFLNAACMRLHSNLKDKYQMIHITGTKEFFSILKIYNTIGKKAFVKDFYYNMEVLYSAADAVVSRCGASSIAEIAYYRLPAILIPHPQAGGHQTDNARYLEKQSAAYVMTQDSFSDQTFATLVKGLLFDKALQHTMSNNLNAVKFGVQCEDFCTNIVL